MKNLLIMLAMTILIGSAYGQTGTGAFGSDCPTLAMQQAAYNASLSQSKANAIVVRDTASQQLQTYHAQIATHWNQTYKTLQQDQKTAQQIAKDTQQKNKDQQQIDTDARLLTVDAAQKAKALELAAREALILNNEQECQDMWVFCNELKLICEKVDHTDKEVSDHVKAHINHSGLSDQSNPGSSTQDNGGILNPSN